MGYTIYFETIEEPSTQELLFLEILDEIIEKCFGEVDKNAQMYHLPESID